MPVVRPVETDFGPHSLRMPIAPLGDRDGRRTIGVQVRLGTDVLQVEIVIREELCPAPQWTLVVSYVGRGLYR